MRGSVSVLLLLSILGFCAVMILLAVSDFGKNWLSHYNKKSSFAANQGTAQLPEILEITLKYDFSQTSKFVIDSLVRKHGHVPNHPQEGQYLLKVLDTNQTSLYQKTFAVHTYLADPPPLPGTQSISKAVVLNQGSLVVNTPWFPTMSRIEIWTVEGQRLISEAVVPDEITRQNNAANFTTIGGKDASAQASGFGNGKLDIAIISDDYTDMAQFRQDVQTIVAGALTYAPFNTRSSQIAFHLIENTVDLQCAISPSLDRLLVCNNSIAFQQVNNSAVPWDYVYVLVNNPTYGGSGGSIGVGYNGPWKIDMFVHELLGHTFGLLLDEYQLYTSNGQIDNRIYGLYGSTDGNCYAGLPPAAAWNGLVQPADYFQSCNYPNWYRSSASSIMLTFGGTTFNPVSIGVLNRRIDAVVNATPIPTPTPTPIPTATPIPVFSNLSSQLTESFATFNFAFSGSTGGYYVDMSTLSDMSFDVYLYFGQGLSSPVAVANPQIKWDKYRCGSTLYWRVWDINRLTSSPIQTATINCPSASPSPTLTPTPQPSPYPGDANNDRKVDIFDYNIIVGQFNQTGTNLSGDLNKSGKVDIFDYNLVVANFGRTQ